MIAAFLGYDHHSAELQILGWRQLPPQCHSQIFRLRITHQATATATANYAEADRHKREREAETERQTMVMSTRVYVALLGWMLLAQFLVGEVKSEAASYSKIDKWHNVHRIVRRKEEAKWMTHPPMYTQQTVEETEAPYEQFDEGVGENAWDGSGSSVTDTIVFIDGSRDAGDDGSEDDGSNDGLSVDFGSELEAQLDEFRKIRSPAAAAIQEGDKELAENNEFAENNDDQDGSSPSVQIDELQVIPDEEPYDYSAANRPNQPFAITSVAAAIATTLLAFVV